MTDQPRTSSRRARRTGLRTVVGVVVGAVMLVAVAIAVPFSSPRETTDPVAPAAVPQVVFAEFTLEADLIYVAPADNPDARVLLGEIEHATGWGINPGPEMAGTRFAYTVLPVTAAGRQDAPAELWTMDTGTLEHTRLARDADLLVAPRFTDDGAAVIYRRSGGGQQELVRLDLATSTREVVHAERTAFGIFPIGYAADGQLVYARLSPAGTEILGVLEGHSPTLLFQASDNIARDWQIDPGGRHLAYLSTEEQFESIYHRAQVTRLGSGEPLPLAPIAETHGEQYAPTWTEDGAGLAIGLQATPDGPGNVIVTTLDGRTQALPAPEQGFDVPKSWSPDGRFLAARTFTGFNSVQPGEESAVILDSEGARYPIASISEVIFIGWIDHA